MVVGVSKSSTTRRLLLVTNVVQPIPAIKDVPVEVVPLDHALTSGYLSKFTDAAVELDASFPRLATVLRKHTLSKPFNLIIVKRPPLDNNVKPCGFYRYRRVKLPCCTFGNYSCQQFVFRRGRRPLGCGRRRKAAAAVDGRRSFSSH